MSRPRSAWISSPDGSVKKQLTTSATADNKYRMPSQTDDGRVVAVRKASGSSAFAFFLRASEGQLLDTWPQRPRPGPAAGEDPHRRPAPAAKALRGGLPAGLRCDEACRASITAFVAKATARKLGLGKAKTRVGGGGSLEGAGKGRARVVFTTKAKGRLAKAARVPLILTAEIRDEAGNSPDVSAAVTLKG